MDFRLEPRDGYLLVTATGPFDAEACRAAMTPIMKACMERELANVLVDARAIVELVSIADRFGLARDVVANRLPRIAILVSEPNARHSRAFENTAINRGANVRTTASEAEACAFLGVKLPCATEP